MFFKPLSRVVALSSLGCWLSGGKYSYIASSILFAAVGTYTIV